MSVEVTPSGTRGARFPLSGLPLRVVMRVLRVIHRRQGYRSQGMDVLMLTTIGARSGQTRTTPVTFFADGEGAWLIVASKGGSQHHPAWLHNLAAHPEGVSIELPGDRRVKVRARTLVEGERATAWPRIVSEVSRFGDYEQQTDREIPVIRLERIPD